MATAHLSAQVEQFKDVLDDHGRELLKRHWEEIALDQDRVEYAPDWSKYAELDRDGKLSIVTLRSEGIIVGYCVMVIATELHYSTTLTATMDIFWLAPEHRGHMGGPRLFKAVEAECRRRGCKRIYVGSKLHKDTSRLFLAMGYKAIEVWYSKLLAAED